MIKYVRLNRKSYFENLLAVTKQNEYILNNLTKEIKSKQNLFTLNVFLRKKNGNFDTNTFFQDGLPRHVFVLKILFHQLGTLAKFLAAKDKIVNFLFTISIEIRAIWRFAI